MPFPLPEETGESDVLPVLEVCMFLVYLSLPLEK
jgi:hypothetical protein